MIKDKKIDKSSPTPLLVFKISSRYIHCTTEDILIEQSQPGKIYSLHYQQPKLVQNPRKTITITKVRSQLPCVMQPKK